MIEQLNDKDKKAYALIRNMIIHGSKSPTLQDINGVTEGKSPRSASLVLDRLIKAGLIKKYGRKIRLTNMSEPTHASISVIEIPLVGTVACGLPILAEENIEAHIPVSTALAKKGYKYFLLRASGDSMNLADINDRDILLIRQQTTADNGEKVVALINDEATVKILDRSRDAVILRPKSTNTKHKPIVVTEQCQIQGIVVAVLPPDIY